MSTTTKARTKKPRLTYTPRTRADWQPQIDYQPPASSTAEAPPWNDGLEAELEYACLVAQRFIADEGYPWVAVSNWLLLAMKAELDRLRSCCDNTDHNVS